MREGGRGKDAYGEREGERCIWREGGGKMHMERGRGKDAYGEREGGKPLWWIVECVYV